ncbi:hypothetical protein [Flavicella sediminum]|uniref:hypothetical protein n=1 Tax=Flavicella sediminum TaxID=2585141 RepID=UPI001123B31D|nr:hypothetical protein [Flavicella sediminum]
MVKNLCTILVVLLATACGLTEDTSDKKTTKAVARVNDAVLYQEDLATIIPKGISKGDSVVVVREFINSWAKEELLLAKSKLNMPAQNERLEALVKKYEKDLFINSFKEALLKQQLDTIVNHEQIAAYYEKNKESFRINEELLKFKYIHLDPKNKNKYKLRNLLISKGANDLQLLDEAEDQMLSSFLSDSIWIRYADVLNKLPVLKSTSKKTLIKKNAFLQKVDSTGLYYVYIKEVMQKNEIAPIRYIAGIIRKMILHQRKLELVNTVEKVLIDDAIKNKQFEIY